MDMLNASAESVHVPFFVGAKGAFKQHIMHAEFIRMLSHFGSDINPEGVLCDSVFIVLSVKVKSVTYELNSQKTDYYDVLSVLPSGLAISCIKLTRANGSAFIFAVCFESAEIVSCLAVQMP